MYNFNEETELADYLSAKGMPFREAHEVTGKLVFTCIQRGYCLKDLPLAELQEASPLISDDIYGVLLPKTVVASRNLLSGSGLDQVDRQLGLAKQLIG